MTRSYRPRYVPCKRAGCPNRTQSVEELCSYHRSEKVRPCQDCGTGIVGARVNRKFCVPCRRRRYQEQNTRCKRNPTRRMLHEPNHPCVECGVNVPGRAARCGPCQHQHQVAYVRAQRAKARAGKLVEVEPEPEAPRPVYPCSLCRHGVASKEAESGWLCARQVAGRCAPWAGATMMEAK